MNFFSTSAAEGRCATPSFFRPASASSGLSASSSVTTCCTCESDDQARMLRCNKGSVSTKRTLASECCTTYAAWSVVLAG